MRPSLCCIISLFLLFSSCSNDVIDIRKDESIYKNGDLVFRLGDSSVSNAVMVADESSDYSHIGIVVVIKSQPYIIHACPSDLDEFSHENTVKMDDVSDFFSSKNAINGALLRYSDEHVAEQAANSALRLFNKNIPFDYSLNSADSLEMYCTELIEYCYLQQGVSLTNNERHAVMIPGFDIDNCILISDFLRSDKLELIGSF